MPTRSADSQSGLVRLVKRYGAKAGIIAVGAAIAVGSLQQTRFLPKPPIIQHPFSDALTGRATALASSDSTKSANVLGANVEHDKIAQWMTKLTTTMRTGVEAALGRKSQYNDMIAAKLEARHMPADLIYLAMIESEFNPTATSPVKAKGLWQFMASTARQFGLIVRGKTDERTNPEKATDAALTYLNDLHTRFGSWLLAAAAYNSGGGTVSKALRQVTGKTTGTDSDFFKILPKLPKETQDYVPKLIATARVGNDPLKYGLTVKEAGGDVAALLPTTTPVPFVSDSTKAMVTAGSSVATKATADKSATKTVAKKVAVKSSATTRKAAVKKPAVKKPVIKKPVIKKPVVKKPLVKKPALKKPVVKKPITKKTTRR
jgi:hypothetical protein